MSVSKISAVLLALIALAIGPRHAAAAPQPEPSGQAARSQAASDRGAVPSYQRDLREKYGPLYRTSPRDLSSRLDALRRSYRYRPSYRQALPLNRSGSYRSWPPNYYRRVTPYYDGRGYGVPSTSPYRYRQDLDGRIRSRRR